MRGLWLAVVVSVLAGCTHGPAGPAAAPGLDAALAGVPHVVFAGPVDFVMNGSTATLVRVATQLEVVGGTFAVREGVAAIVPVDATRGPDWCGAVPPAVLVHELAGPDEPADVGAWTLSPGWYHFVFVDVSEYAEWGLTLAVPGEEPGDLERVRLPGSDVLVHTGVRSADYEGRAAQVELRVPPVAPGDLQLGFARLDVADEPATLLVSHSWRLAADDCLAQEGASVAPGGLPQNDYEGYLAAATADNASFTATLQADDAVMDYEVVLDVRWIVVDRPERLLSSAAPRDAPPQGSL